MLAGSFYFKGRDKKVRFLPADLTIFCYRSELQAVEVM